MKIILFILTILFSTNALAIRIMNENFKAKVLTNSLDQECLKIKKELSQKTFTCPQNLDSFLAWNYAEYLKNEKSFNSCSKGSPNYFTQRADQDLMKEACIKQAIAKNPKYAKELEKFYQDNQNLLTGLTVFLVGITVLFLLSPLII